MAINNIVGDPEKIGISEEVEFCLSRIESHERENGCCSGVLFTQRRQFRELYEIVSEEEAKEVLSRPVLGTSPEFGLKFYTKAYFEELKKKLSGDRSITLSDFVLSRKRPGYQTVNR